MKLRVVAALVAIALPALGQYSGPAILSRGEAPSVISLPEIRFSPYVALGGTYDSGLSTTAVADTGQLANYSSFGTTLTWGISGAHSWKNHTRLGLAYSGSVTRYAKNVGFNGLSQSMMIGLTHSFSPHVQVEWRQTAGITTRNYDIAGLVETVPFDPGSSYIPTTDFFDNRNVYLTSSLGLTYSLSRRLSLRLSGLAFTENRDSHSLTSAWGTQEGADLQYRLNARTTVGGGYNYMHFAYAQYGGGTDTHSVRGSYSVRLNRRWEFSAYAGIMRIESKYLQTLPVDPVIQALLGITSTLQIGHFLQTTPTLSARLARSFHRGVGYISGDRVVSPGNGLFLTSIQTAVTAGYNYSGFRRWSFNTGAGYVRANSEGLISGNYGNITLTASAGRQLTRYLGLSSSIALRDYRSNNFSNYNRRITTATVGLYFSPGDVRLPSW